MPGKPRFYNNQRVLNPRHAIVQTPQAITALAPVSLVGLNITGTNDIQWDFDADVLDVGDFQNLLLLEAALVLDWSDPIAYSEAPLSIVQSGPRTITATYTSTPGSITHLGLLIVNSNTGVIFIGRNINSNSVISQLMTP